MAINDMIYKLRMDANLSQEQFANIFNVSRQSVQKWENGISVPELSKIIEISKRFDVSLDSLILNRDYRIAKMLKYSKKMTPNYSYVHDWEYYTSGILTEYQQSIDEGLDIEGYKELFKAVSRLPKDEVKKKFGDVLYDVIINADTRQDYKYFEPSNIEEIRGLQKDFSLSNKLIRRNLEDKIYGAWIGRMCGCMLGKTVCGICTDELISFLKEINNYPMHRYIYKSDINDKICNKYNFNFFNVPYADKIDGMPFDDNINYLILSQLVIEKFGIDFTPYDVSRIWLGYQPRDAYCTTERVAFCNFVNGYEPPQSAFYKNPYREWNGAQIRGDYYGYINPGNPVLAAEMAWRDASISHVKNGIYGEMFVAAMIAVAAVTKNMEQVILGGLSRIPYTSRLYEDIIFVLDSYKNGVSKKKCFGLIHEKYDEHNEYDWNHTNPNIMVVAASLLYGEGDYSKSICMAVETGFNTACNGATVGSVLGMVNGFGGIDECWKKVIHDTLYTLILGIGTAKISERVKLTMEHINNSD